MMRTVYGEPRALPRDLLREVSRACTSPATAASATRTATTGSPGASTTCSTSPGHRIGTAEVESALVMHADVVEAAVVGMPHDDQGPGDLRVRAAQGGRDAATRASSRSSSRSSARQIGAFAAPDVIHVAPGLPKTAVRQDHAADPAESRGRRDERARRRHDARRPGRRRRASLKTRPESGPRLIPIRVEKPVFSPPVMTWVLIAVNVAVFLWMQHGGAESFERKIFEYSAIPQNVRRRGRHGAHVRGRADRRRPRGGTSCRTYSDDYDPERIREQTAADGPGYFYVRGRIDAVPLDAIRQKVHPWLTLLTAMFMHAGWMHLIGNMWFLHVFGSSVEDVLGKLAYLVFYLLVRPRRVGGPARCTTPQSIVPFLGASGAIAGVMGAFAVRFPGAQVLTLIPIVLYTLAHLPAWLFMVIYIGEQIFMSLVHTRENGGVAWWAHIGGFAAGYILVAFSRSVPPGKACFRGKPGDPFS